MTEDFFDLKKGFTINDVKELKHYRIDDDTNKSKVKVTCYNKLDFEDSRTICFAENGIIESVEIISKLLNQKDSIEVFENVKAELICIYPGSKKTQPENFLFLSNEEKLKYVENGEDVYYLWNKQCTSSFPESIESILLELKKSDNGYIWVIKCGFNKDKVITEKQKQIDVNPNETQIPGISLEDLSDNEQTVYENSSNYSETDIPFENETPGTESEQKVTKKEFESETIQKANIVHNKRIFWKGIAYYTSFLVIFLAAWIWFLFDPIKRNESVLNSIYYAVYFMYTIASCILPVIILYKFVVFKKDVVYAKQYLFDDSIKISPKTQSIWKAYKSTFFDKNFGIKSKTRASADLYFNYESVIGSMNKWPIIPWFKLIGGSFLGLGILGTFIGFSIGLSTIDFRTESTTKIMEGIEALVKNGLATAFNTSIVGILLSLLYNFFIYNPLLKKINDYFEDLSDNLDKEFYVSETEALMQYTMVTDKNSENIPFSQSLRFIIENMNKQTDALNNFNDNLADKIANINDSVKSSLGQFVNGVGSEVKDVVVENVHEEMTELKASISDAAKDFATAAEKLFDTPDILEKANSELKSYLESTRTSFSEMLAENERTNKTILDKVVATVEEHLAEQFSKFSQSLITALDSAKKVADILSDTPERIEKIEKVLIDKESEVADKFDIASNKLSDISTGMTDYLRTMQNGIATILQDLSNAEENVKALLASAKLHEDNSERNLTSVIKETKRMLEGFKAVDVNLKNIFESIGNEIEKYNLTVGSTLDQYLESFEKGSKAFSNSITGSMQEFETAIDSLSEYMLDVQKSSNQFGESVIKLSEILDNKKKDQ